MIYPLFNTDGCEPFTDDHFWVDDLMIYEKSNNKPKPIIMVDNGGCHFV